jgi:putative membrane protein
MTASTASIRAIAFSVLLATPAFAQPPRPQDPAQPPTATQPPRPGDMARDAKAQGSVPAGDQAFARKVAEESYKEIALAKLAQSKASSDEVKSYAQTLDRDHLQAYEELKSWAAQKNVTLPPPPATGKSGNAKLEALEGAAFDKAYIAAMVADHKKDVAAFEKHASSAVEPDLKAFVQKTLPTLKGHLEQAEKLQTTLAGKRTSS